MYKQSDSPCLPIPQSGRVIQGAAFVELSNAIDRAQAAYQDLSDSGDREMRVFNGQLNRDGDTTGKIPPRTVIYPVMPLRSQAPSTDPGTGDCGDYYAAAPDAVRQAPVKPLAVVVDNTGIKPGSGLGALCNSGAEWATGKNDPRKTETNDGWLWLAGLAVLAIAASSKSGGK